MIDHRTVMAVRVKGTNADLIQDCARLGYLPDDDSPVLDPTYGLGRFWRTWRPRNLIAHDLDPTRSPGEPMDFTALTYPDAFFAAVVFDPPYKLNGTGGSHPSDDAYGVAAAGVSLAERRSLMLAGVSECCRVLRPKGHLLVKCQDQVNGGRVRWQTLDVITHVTDCDLVDRLDLVSYRPQPVGRTQQHARRNHSTLLVLRKR